MMNAGIGAIFFIPLMLLYIGILGVGIYCMVLFIKLAQRGILLMDMHISKGRKEMNNEQ